VGADRVDSEAKGAHSADDHPRDPAVARRQLRLIDAALHRRVEHVAIVVYRFRRIPFVVSFY
jgi:hypothetical protein